MAESITISKNPELENSQDYEFLRKAGQEYIAALGSKIWTDYNLHDPGITILEMLAYSITDLGYRVSYDIEDILALSPDKKYFHTAREILTSAPVSVDDLRKVIIDQDGVKNAWLTRSDEQEVDLYVDLRNEVLKYEIDGDPEDFRSVELNGLYKVLLEFEESEEFGDLNDTLINWELEDLEVENDFPTWVDLRDREDGEAVREWIKSGKTENIEIIPDENGDLYQYNTDRSAYAVTVRLTYTLPHRADDLEYYLDLSFYVDFEGSLRDADESGDVTEMVTNGDLIGFYQGKIKAILEVVERVTCRLHEVRPFDEDYFSVDSLKTEEVVICADIELEKTADVNAVMAEVLFQLSNFISPPINWYRLPEMFSKGYTSDQIFEGPALESGFIDPEELENADRASILHASDLIQIIMDVEGVVAVKSLLMADYLDGEFVDDGQEWELELAGGEAYVPRLSINKSDLTFFKGGLPFIADSKKVDQALMELKARELRPRLKEVNLDIDVPEGIDRNIGRYHSIQNDFPLFYGVGQAGVPSKVGGLRQAQARQLKAFLLFFDQLLANYFAQLANVRELFSMETSIERTYFYQLLMDTRDAEKVKDLNDPDTISFLENEADLDAFKQLYKESRGVKNLGELFVDYDSGAGNVAEKYASIDQQLAGMVEDEDGFIERRNKFLDHLLARFNESFNEYSLLMFNLDGDKAIDELVKDKLSFLNDYPLLSSRRGQGFNYQPQCCDCAGGIRTLTLYWNGATETDLHLYDPSTGSTFTYMVEGVLPNQEVEVQAGSRYDEVFPETLVIEAAGTGNEPVELDMTCESEIRGQYGDLVILDYGINFSHELWDTDNVTGLKRRVARLLGVDEVERKSLACDLFQVEPVPGNDTALFRYFPPGSDEYLMTSAEAYPAGEDYADELRSGESFIGELCAMDMIDRAIYYTEIGLFVAKPELEEGFPFCPDETGLTYQWAPEAGVADPNSRSSLLSPTCSTTYTITASEGTLEKCTQEITIWVEGCGYPENHAAVSENFFPDGHFPNTGVSVDSDLSLDSTPPLLIPGAYTLTDDASFWGMTGSMLDGTDHTVGGGTLVMLCSSENLARPWYHQITVEDGKTYHLSLWVKNVVDDPLVPATEIPGFRLRVDEGGGITEFITSGTEFVPFSSGWVQLNGTYEATFNGPVTFEVWVDNQAPGTAMVYALDDIELVEIAVPEPAFDQAAIAPGESVEMGMTAWRFLIANPCWDPETDPWDELIAVSRGFDTEEERDEAAAQAEADIKKYCASEGFHVLEHILLRPKFAGSIPLDQNQEEGEIEEYSEFGQSFTPGLEGTLSKVAFFGSLEYPGTLTIELVGGSPSTIHEQSFVPVSNELTWREFTLVETDATGETSPANIEIAPDHQYRFIITLDEVEEVTGATIGVGVFRGTGGYDGGEAWLEGAADFSADLMFRTFTDDGETRENANSFLPVCVNKVEPKEFNCDLSFQVIDCGPEIGLCNDPDTPEPPPFSSAPSGSEVVPNQNLSKELREAYAFFLNSLTADELESLLAKLEESDNPDKTFRKAYNNWLEKMAKEEETAAGNGSHNPRIVEFVNSYLLGRKKGVSGAELYELIGKLSSEEIKTLIKLLEKYLAGETIPEDYKKLFDQYKPEDLAYLFSQLNLYLEGGLASIRETTGKEEYVPPFEEEEYDPLMVFVTLFAERERFSKLEREGLASQLTDAQKLELLNILRALAEGQKPGDELERKVADLPASTREAMMLVVAESLHRSQQEGIGKTENDVLSRFLEKYRANEFADGMEEAKALDELGKLGQDRLLAQAYKDKYGGTPEPEIGKQLEQMTPVERDELMNKLALAPRAVNDTDNYGEKAKTLLDEIVNDGSVKELITLQENMSVVNEKSRDRILADVYRYRETNFSDPDFLLIANKMENEDIDRVVQSLVEIPGTGAGDIQKDYEERFAQQNAISFLESYIEQAQMGFRSKLGLKSIFDSLTDAGVRYLDHQLEVLGKRIDRDPDVARLLLKLSSKDRSRLKELLALYRPEALSGETTPEKDPGTEITEKEILEGEKEEGGREIGSVLEYADLLDLLLADRFNVNPDKLSAKEREEMLFKLIADFSGEDPKSLAPEKLQVLLRRMLEQFVLELEQRGKKRGRLALINLMLASKAGVDPQKLSDKEKKEILDEIIGKRFGVDAGKMEYKRWDEYLVMLLEEFFEEEGLDKYTDFETFLEGELFYTGSAQGTGGTTSTPTAPVPPTVYSGTDPEELIRNIRDAISIFSTSEGVGNTNLNEVSQSSEGCFRFILRDAEGNLIFTSRNFETSRKASDLVKELIGSGIVRNEVPGRKEKERYTLETTPGGKYFFNIYELGPDGVKDLDKLIGSSPKYDTQAELDEALVLMTCNEDCYVTETYDRDYCIEDADPYSFRATVIMPSWPRKFRSPGFRELAEETLRLEAPAHVALKICWIDRSQMGEFEQRYQNWLEVNGDCHKTAEEKAPALNELVDYLNNLKNIYPGQTLHDCESDGGAAGRVILGNSSIGSL